MRTQKSRSSMVYSTVPVALVKIYFCDSQRRSPCIPRIFLQESGKYQLKRPKSGLLSWWYYHYNISVWKESRTRPILPSCVNHGWELSVIHYHGIIVIYPYPFLVIITQFFSWIIFINDCICVLTGLTGWYFLAHIYYTKNHGLWEFSNFLKVMLDYHNHVENRVITW